MGVSHRLAFSLAGIAVGVQMSHQQIAVSASGDALCKCADGNSNAVAAAKANLQQTIVDTKKATAGAAAVAREEAREEKEAAAEAAVAAKEAEAAQMAKEQTKEIGAAKTARAVETLQAAKESEEATAKIEALQMHNGLIISPANAAFFQASNYKNLGGGQTAGKKPLSLVVGNGFHAGGVIKELQSKYPGKHVTLYNENGEKMQSGDVILSGPEGGEPAKLTIVVADQAPPAIADTGTAKAKTEGRCCWKFFAVCVLLLGLGAVAFAAYLGYNRYYGGEGASPSAVDASDASP